MTTKTFNVGDIVKGDFDTIVGVKHTLATIADVMESDEGQVVNLVGDGILPQWVPADQCTLLRGVPLEGSLMPDEAAIIKRMLAIQATDENIVQLINIAYAHERSGTLTRDDRKIVTKQLEKYRDEQRSQYVKLSKRLVELYNDREDT